ncbi:MAG: DUF3987 domain-containing protein [Prevotella sp.]|nr:DUF3987 domain-containing protein [Prevotella sp.]
MAFGIALSVRSRVRECTPALFNQVVDSEQTARVCAEIEDALERARRGEMSREDFETFKAEQKKRLAIFTPHAMFPKGRRANGDAVPSGLSMYDVDHIPDPRGYFRSMIGDRVGELGIVLAHVTPSTEGLRLFFAVPAGMSLEEAQRWMSRQLGDSDYDGCVKDLARCSFAVPRDYILYLDEEGLFKERKVATVAEDMKSPAQSIGTALPDEHWDEQGAPIPGETPEPSFKGIPYKDIIREWWYRNGGEPQEGERNVKLHKLAVNLRAICDNRREVLMAVMPRFGLSEAELRSIVDSACKEEPKGVSRTLASVIGQLALSTSHSAGDDFEGTDNGLPPTVCVQPSKLPLGLKESLVGVPASMHMPVLCAVLPIAAAYADGVRVDYCDGNQHHLGLMSIVRGEQASNKSVCKNAVDVWKRQLDEEDALARKREEEWKERKKGRKANEKAPEDPKVLIRVVPVTVSCSTLLKRFKNSGGHTLYSFGEELDTLRKTNGAGSWSSKYDIYRLSFDQGEWGQDYNSDQAESGVVNVAYNWTMLGTNGAMRKCFKSDNIENGLSSRILVAEMPDSSFQKMPKFGKRSMEDEARIQEAVTRLRSRSGLVDVPRLRKAIEAWVEEKRVEAAKDIDHVKDIYRKRAAVIGFRCGVVFHLLSGKDKESKACLDFAQMMAEYCLAQQIKTFGEALQNQYVEARNECQRYGVNHSVFDQLAPTFSRDDLRALKHDCSESGLRNVIMRWKRDGWIEPIDRHHWRKVAIEQEQKDARIASAEREQARSEVRASQSPVVPSSR